MTTEVTSGLRVYVRHLRAAKLCTRGGREWWARHDLDWNDFLSNGIPAETLRATNDALALRVVAEAEAEAANGQG